MDMFCSVSHVGVFIHLVCWNFTVPDSFADYEPMEHLYQRICHGFSSTLLIYWVSMHPVAVAASSHRFRHYFEEC